MSDTCGHAHTELQVRGRHGKMPSQTIAELGKQHEAFWCGISVAPDCHESREPKVWAVVLNVLSKGPDGLVCGLHTGLGGLSTGVYLAGCQWMHCIAVPVHGETLSAKQCALQEGAAPCALWGCLPSPNPPALRSSQYATDAPEPSHRVPWTASRRQRKPCQSYLRVSRNRWSQWRPSWAHLPPASAPCCSGCGR